MKLVSFVSFKGGAGKSTALMAVTSTLINSGYRVALFEADDNWPLSMWRDNAITNERWSDQCTIFDASNMQNLEQAFEVATNEGFDFALADTRGGASDLNNAIVANSDMAILPTQLTPMDIDEMLATFRYVVEICKSEKIKIAYAVLQQRVPNTLTIAQKSSQDLLDALPQFRQVLHERDAFAAQKMHGLLHKSLEDLDKNPMSRLQANNYKKATTEIEEVVKDILDELGMSSRILEKV